MNEFDNINNDEPNINNSNNLNDTGNGNNDIEPSDNSKAANYSSYNVSENVRYENDQDFSDNNYNTATFEVNTVKEKKKTGFGKKIASYVAVGLVCSVIGGVSAGIATVYLLPKTGTLSTPLYYSAASTSGTKATSTSSTTGTLTAAEIAKKVGPAVVGISTKTSVSNDPFGLQGGTQEGYGSGIIINDQGYILTNYHVVSGASTMKVIFNNKKEVNAKVVNYDSSMDLAVIKVTDSDVKMPGIAELGNSKDLQVGDPVVAIGNPLGQEFLGSVTSGIISATNRQVQVDSTSTKTETLIQTDAAINEGNSGGPLINSQGQVIGINCAKISSSTSSSSATVEGMGFAIPIDLVKPKISTLTKPLLMLGITAVDVSDSDSKKNDIPVGVGVEQVASNSNAERAGIKSGDVITKFDGKTVKTTAELNTIKGEHKSGDSVKVEIYRDGETKTLTITLSES